MSFDILNNVNLSDINEAFNGAVELFKQQSTPIQVAVGAVALIAITGFALLIGKIISKIWNWNTVVHPVTQTTVDDATKANKLAQDLLKIIKPQAEEKKMQYDQLVAIISKSETAPDSTPKLEALKLQEQALLAKAEMKVVFPVNELMQQSFSEIESSAKVAEAELTTLKTAYDITKSNTARASAKLQANNVVHATAKNIHSNSVQAKHIYEKFLVEKEILEKETAELQKIRNEIHALSNPVQKASDLVSKKQAIIGLGAAGLGSILAVAVGIISAPVVGIVAAGTVIAAATLMDGEAKAV
jgi:hypothetical protein